MQTVSNEWMTNIESINRKQGFINIEIMSNPNSINISTLNDSGKYLKELIFNQSYDPMGFSLPTANIDIYLYNYNGTYDEFYKNYASERILVTVEFGFRLSADEKIKCGTFIITDVSLADKTLNIHATSKLELLNADEIEIDLYDNEYTVIYQSENEDGDLTADVFEKASQTYGHYFNRANKYADANILFDDIANEIIAVPNETHLVVADLLQKCSNITGARLFINRDGQAELSKHATISGGFISDINMLNEPDYSRSKKIRLIKVDTTTEGTATEIKQYSQSMMNETVEENTNISIIQLDNEKSKILKVNGYISVNQGREIYIKKISRNYLTNELKIEWVDDRGEVTTGGLAGTGYIEVKTQIKRENASYLEEYSQSGEICDITNDLGNPNLLAVSNYFENRDIYEVIMRGNPALDVGDYMLFRVGSDYKNALILDRELTFDGAFTDTLKIRLIDTQFESVKGNTHENLSNYTHQQLSNYTHQQLQREVI